MKRLGTLVLQNIFFPGLKVAPSSKWRDSIKQFGPAKSIKVNRSGSEICALLLQPKVADTLSCKPEAVAILSHPLSKKAKYYFASTQALSHYLGAGIPVLLFDYNGFGESSWIDMYYWKDAKAVIMPSQ